MGTRRGRAGSPLEWVAQHDLIAAAATSLVRSPLNLNLDDDEVAEIWKIDSEVEISLPDDPAADKSVVARVALMMDPSFPTEPGAITSTVFEDLEALFTHDFTYRNQFVTAVGVYMGKTSDKKVLDFNVKPLLVATNIAMLEQSDAGSDITYRLRLYFTRKKAGKDDLTRILLKRR